MVLGGFLSFSSSCHVRCVNLELGRLHRHGYNIRCHFQTCSLHLYTPFFRIHTHGISQKAISTKININGGYQPTRPNQPPFQVTEGLALAPSAPLNLVRFMHFFVSLALPHPLPIHPSIHPSAAFSSFLAFPSFSTTALITSLGWF